jgi:hypothetical protein
LGNVRPVIVAIRRIIESKNNYESVTAAQLSRL